MSSKLSYRDFYTYSLIKTLYQKNKSFLEVFFPFVLNSIGAKNTSITELEKNIKKTFELNIPVLTLKDILKKLRKNELISYSEDYGNIFLTEKGKSGVYDYLEDNTKVYGELNKIFTKIGLHLQDKIGIFYDNKKIYEQLEEIINANFRFFIDYFNPSRPLGKKTILSGSDDKLKKYISDFIFEELEKGGESFETFKKIVYGALLCATLTQDNLLVNLGSNYNIADLTVYLDSNILLSLFGGHGKEGEKGMIQLLDLMKKSGVKIKIFEFTLDETISVLEGYFKEKHKFIRGYDVDSVYQNFVNNGLTDNGIYKLITEFEIIIKRDFGIQVDTDLNTKKLNFDGEAYEIEEFVDKPAASKHHDILAIEAIKFYRNKSSPRILELSKFIFLSLDRKLFIADCRIHNKSLSNNKIPHVLPPEYISNYLWLKKPDWASNLPIQIVFSSLHSHGLIDKNVWNKFYETSTDMLDEGEITQDDWILLVGSNEFRNELVEMDKSKAINEKLVVKNIETARKQISNETYGKAFEIVNADFKTKSEIRDKEKEIEIRNKYVENIKIQNLKKANAITVMLLFFFILAYFYGCYKLYIFFKPELTIHWSEIEGTVSFGQAIIGPIISLLPFSSIFGYQKIKEYIYKFLVERDINNYLS